MKKAVYPGSFDPVTVGHIDIIKKAASHFDEITVAVMINYSKQPVFTIDERVGMLEKIVKAEGLENVSIDHFEGLLAEYVRKNDLHTIVKGLRAVSDFEYEFQMALANKRLNKEADTVFFIADEPNLYVSSGIIRDIGKHGGDISSFVSPCILKEVSERLKEC